MKETWILFIYIILSICFYSKGGDGYGILNVWGVSKNITLDTTLEMD